jgi:hypothetical protein
MTFGKAVIEAMKRGGAVLWDGGGTYVRIKGDGSVNYRIEDGIRENWWVNGLETWKTGIAGGNVDREKEKFRYGCSLLVSVSCVFFIIGLFIGMWLGV